MIGSRARSSAYQIRKILFAPGARGVCHDPEKPFFGNLPRVSFRSPSPRFLQTPRNRPRHNTPPPLSVKGSQSRSGKRPHHPHVHPYLPAGIPMPLHCVSSSTSTPRSAEFRKPHLCRLPLSGNALQRWNESILLSSPHLLLSKKPPCILSWTPLFSDSSYVAHTSRRPWQRRPYMAHNRLRACVKFVGSSSAIPVFLAPSEHVPQLHISSTAPLLPAKLKPRFS